MVDFRFFVRTNDADGVSSFVLPSRALHRVVLSRSRRKGEYKNKINDNDRFCKNRNVTGNTIFEKSPRNDSNYESTFWPSYLRCYYLHIKVAYL